jgi:dimethylglycine dehydrogenase
VVGWVTSGGYGHFVEKSLAQGYIPRALAERDESGVFEIEILGIRQSATIAIEPLFDPSGAKMRS